MPHRIRTLLLSAIVLLLAHVSVAQNFDDYIVVDSVQMAGKVERKGNDQLYFSAHKEDPGTTYQLIQVEEYSIKGIVYAPLSPNGQREFYKRLSKGDLTFYKRGQHFVLKADGQTTILKPGTFRKELAARAVNCPTKDFSRVALNGTSIKKFAQAYNAGNCNIETMDYWKFGVYAGFTLINLKGDLQMFSGNSQPSSTASLGFFVDIPLSRSRTYFSTDMMFTKFSANFYKASGSIQDYFGLDGKATQLSTSIKYLLLNKRLTPYIKGGLTFSSVSSDPRTPYVRAVGTTNVSMETFDFSKNSNSSFGLFPAVGIHLPLVGRLNAHAEIRYNYSLFRISSTDHTKSADLTMSNLLLAAGINF